VFNLIKNAKFARVEDATAAGTSDIETAGVDTTGFESLVFIVPFGTITSGAVTSIKLQQSSDDGSSDAYSDLEDTAQTVADTKSNTIFLAEIHRPQKRYVRLVVDRGTQNAVVEGITVILHDGVRYAPITQPATVGGSELSVSPDEGTA
jgi:hypothetical protein